MGKLIFTSVIKLVEQEIGINDCAQTLLQKKFFIKERKKNLIILENILNYSELDRKK